MAASYALAAIFISPRVAMRRESCLAPEYSAACFLFRGAAMSSSREPYRASAAAYSRLWHQTRRKFPGLPDKPQARARALLSADQATARNCASDQGLR